mgnify:FL=1
MERVVVFGIGYECKRLLEQGLWEHCHVVEFVEREKERWGEILKQGGGG